MHQLSRNLVRKNEVNDKICSTNVVNFCGNLISKGFDMRCVQLLVSFFLVSSGSCQGTEEEARKYLNVLEGRYAEACNKQVTAVYNFRTNINDETKEASGKADDDYLKFQAQVQLEILKKFPNWREFKDKEVKRQFLFLSIKGPGTMNPASVSNMAKVQGEMERDYNTATVCKFNDASDCTVRLDQIEEIFSNSNDPAELAHYWTAWHDKMSEKVTPKKYEQFVKYQAEMAKANGFKDMSEMWMVEYDDDSGFWTTENFKQQIRDIFNEIKPMYELLHAYVRMKLRKNPVYEKLIDKCGYIPVYLTGNMWGQRWPKFDILRPFPETPSLDATEAMVAKGYTPLKIFKEADNFFTELGLPPMTKTFWEKSMLERPTDGRQVMCHAFAEDFCWGGNNTDFRIIQCTKINIPHLITAHHEMGHIAYYQQYVDQPFIFRNGANNGFHEALGDALALSVVTPKHLQCVLGLDLKQDPSICKDDAPVGTVKATETDLNYLYSKALDIFSFIPFALSMDSWRWEVFEGKLTPDQYNKRWWEIRKTIQGVIPGRERKNSTLFDPAAKFHIPSNIEYLRYFISYIIQFQFYEAMCTAAGQFDPKNNNSRPLYQCDFAGSKKVGTLLSDMLKLGFSKPWPQALQVIAGTPKMSIASIKNYFQPFLDYAKNELDKNGEIAGYGESCDEFKKNKT